MATLKLGPLLRHVGPSDATIWVETDRPCVVGIRAGGACASEPTFTVAGHAYAIVTLTGLPSGADIEYEVSLDGSPVWPPAGSPYPPSSIRTIDPARPVRLLFGSCRSPGAVTVRDPTGSGEDVLGAYAQRMAGEPRHRWPDALLMLGDQVYADETSEPTQRFIRARRDTSRPPFTQVVDLEEYTHLYEEAWGDPDIRWLLSTVPSSMIFDDHDVIDDWNTSRSWRRDMQATSWWGERITAALMSYWIYQHIGNLSPDGLGRDPTYAAVRRAPDGEPILREFARRADREADGGAGAMWSYRRDLGPVRLLVIDSRAGRVLDEGRRSMVGDPEFEWIERQVEGGGFAHLVVCTSVPWLLPRALHDLESFDEAITAGSRGRRPMRAGEWLRRALDLEHWAAFRDSFDRLARLIARVGRGEHGDRPPASICVLSGDVHHSYVSKATFEPPLRSRVYQLTVSPFHNSIPLPMRLVFKLAWTRDAKRLSRWLASLGKVPPVQLRWGTTAGPFFGNHAGVLIFDGQAARFDLLKSERAGDRVLARAEPGAARRLA